MSIINLDLSQLSSTYLSILSCQQISRWDLDSPIFVNLYIRTFLVKPALFPTPATPLEYICYCFFTLHLLNDNDALLYLSQLISDYDNHTSSHKSSTTYPKRATTLVRIAKKLGCFKDKRKYAYSLHANN